MRRNQLFLCGDLNVAHKEIDLKNPKSNRENPGFSDEEREKFSCILEEGFIDTYRYLYPNQEGAYSWWSYRMGESEKYRMAFRLFCCFGRNERPNNRSEN